MSLDELRKKEKTTKVAMGALGGILIVQAASSIYLTIQKGFNVFTTLPLVFLPVFLALLVNQKKIKAEILLRTKQ